MGVKTANKFGTIAVSDDAVMMVANHVASECYGVVDLVSRRLTDSLAQLFRSNSNTKGVKITCVDHYIYIDLFVIVKDGVNTDAVTATLSNTVKYAVEQFTGMLVKAVNVNVVGVRV